MDIVKIQTNLLKAMCKNKLPRLLYTYIDDDIIFSTDGCSAYRMAKKDFHLDISDFTPLEDLAQRLHIEQIEDSNVYKQVTKAERCVNANGNELIRLNDEVYVDYKLLKPFESKKTELKFLVESKVAPVQIFEWDGQYTHIGGILPVRVAWEKVEAKGDYYAE